MLSGKCRMQCELMIRILWLCTGKYLSSSKKHSREPQKIEKALEWWDQENYFAKLSFQPNGGQRFTMTIENTISHRSTYSTLPYHCFLLVLVFLSQLAFGGTQTKTGLVPGLGCLGHRAWTSLWFFSWFNLNQTPSLSVFNCWPQKSAFGGSDSCFRSLEHVHTCPAMSCFLSSCTQRLRNFGSWHHQDRFRGQEPAIYQNVKNVKMEFSLQIVFLIKSFQAHSMTDIN